MRVNSLPRTAEAVPAISEDTESSEDEEVVLLADEQSALRLEYSRQRADKRDVRLSVVIVGAIFFSKVLCRLQCDEYRQRGIGG